ncbi:hypothetical protein [Azospirillum picis]|uniref:Uncharacterized protein n=1 Tax=Azospirillum picis TaxID=488438 RepID=A0ABU0MUQ9_9PROT|nr:hypothetical protein [Azospirillum picis]MBP2303304.1 hypothetical protein [Azospirillum picis]MDQ0537156.1 hypothetical protein [Azospirillum picis]
MNALTVEQRYNLLCIADVRVATFRSVDDLVAAARQLEAFVVNGAAPVAFLRGPGEVVAERGIDLEDLGLGNEGAARDWLPELEPGEPGRTYRDPLTEARAHPVSADVPVMSSPDQGQATDPLEAIFAQLQAAVEKGLPCPRNVDLGEPIGLFGGPIVASLVGKLRDDGRIEVESRGCKRRVAIGGRWTLWTGETPVSAAPASDPLETAVLFLRSRGFTVVKVFNDWLLNDRDVTPAELIAKAEQVRTRSPNSKTV